MRVRKTWAAEFEENVELGEQLLLQNKFPGELLEQISDHELRRDVQKRLYSFDVPFQKASTTERKRRSRLLAVQLKHADYLSAKDKYVAIVIVLFLLGLITVLTAIAGMNDNSAFGISSMLVAGGLYAIQFVDESFSNQMGYVSLLLCILVLTEFFVFGWPQTYLEFIVVLQLKWN